MLRSRLLKISCFALLCASAVSVQASGNPACPGASDCPWNSTSSFPATVEGLRDASDVAVDPADGDIYVVERDSNRVVRFEDGDTADPSKRQVWGARNGTGETGDGFGEFEMPESVAVDPDGNVWVTEINGNRVQKFDEDGDVLLILGGNQGGANGQFVFPNDVAVDASGNVYVSDEGESDFSGGGFTQHSRVQKFNSDGVWQAKTGEGKLTNGPDGLAVDGTYVYATQGDQLKRFNASDLTEAPLGDASPEDGVGLVSVDIHGGVAYTTGGGKLYALDLASDTWTDDAIGDNSSPTGLDVATVAGQTYIYVSDTTNPQIRRFQTDFTVVAPLAKAGDEQLFRAGGVAVDGSGHVWVTEGDGVNFGDNYHRVFEYDANGNLIHRFGANGANGSSGNDPGEFSWPQDIAANGSDIYVADSSNNRIQEYDGTDWTVLSAPAGGLEFPSGLDVDTNGDLYVVASSFGDSKVWKLAGGTWTDLGLPGQDDGDFAQDVAVDGSGNVYVAIGNNSNSRILKRAAGDGSWSTIASHGDADGQVNYPRSLEFAAGHVFVADTNNDRAQKLTDTGAFVAKWGAGQYPPMCPGEITDPEGIAVSSDGNQVYVANRLGTGVAKFSFDGAPNVPSCDLTKPGMTLSQPMNGATNVSSTPTFTGFKGNEATDSDTVTLRVFKRDAGSSALRPVGAQQSVTVDSTEWQIAWQGAPLPEGQYWVRATQKDAAGNTRNTNIGSDEWGSSRFTVGAASANTPSPTIDSIAATRDRTPNLSGTASNQGDDSAVTVKIHEGNSTATVVRTLTTPRNGTNWSLADQTWNDNGGQLADGVYTAEAIQTNPLATPQEGKSSGRTFEIDNAPPVVNLANPGDNSFTDSRRPAISGTAGNKTGLSADSDLTFQLQRSTSSGFVPVNQGPISSGFFTLARPQGGTSFSTTIPTDLPDGTYHLRAYQEDTAGNGNPQDTRTSRLFTVDTAAPVVSLNNPADHSETSDPTPLIDGTAGNASNDGDLRFELNRWTGSAWVNHHNWQISHPTSSTSFSTEVPIGLDPGTYHLRVYQGDSVGHEATQGTATSREFTVKPMFNPPVLKITSPAHLSATNQRQPTISGTSDTPGQVKLDLHRWTGSAWVIHGTYYATVVNGLWSIKVPTALPDGAYSPIAYETNLGGQTSNATAGWFFVDTVAPAKPQVTSPANNTKVGTQTPTFSGTADPNAGTNKVYLQLQGYQNSGDWKVLKTEEVTRNGNTWSFKPTDYKLTEGYFAAFVYQYDAAGNFSSSDASSFQVDLNAKAPDNPGTTNDDCQKSLDWGPFHVEGSCLKREGLTWVSTAELTFNGLHLQPDGGSAKVILDPFNLRIAAKGNVKVVLGPTHICLEDTYKIVSDTCFYETTLGPYVLYKGEFDWSWQGKVQLPDLPKFGLPAWGGVTLPQLPGLSGFSLPNLQIPDWGSVPLPDFSKIKGPQIGTLSLPSLNAPNITLPEKYFGNFKFDLPSLSIGTTGASNILGFPVEGRLGLKFQDQGILIDAGLKLPQLLGGVVGDAQLFVGLNGNLLAKNLHFGVGGASMGPIGFRDLNIDYDGSANVWNGSAWIDLPVPPDGLGVFAGAGFKDGQLVNAEAGFEKNFPIGASGLFLYGGKVFFKTVPRRIVGGRISLGLGPAVKGVSAVRVDSDIQYKFADPGYQSSFRFDGGVKVVNIPIASAFVEIFQEGEIDFGGKFGKDFGNGFKAEAYVDGWIQGPEKRFNVYGNGSVQLGDWFKFDGEINVSHIGVGGCAWIQSWGKEVKFGATYKWSGAFDPMWSSCSISAVKAKKASARVAGARQTVAVPGGEEAYVIGFKGRAGAPDVTLTGPKGEHVSTAGHSGLVNKDFLVVHIPQQNLTQVVLHEPAAGAWTAEVDDRSTPVDQILTADSVPTPKVTAKVTGKGYDRRLVYDTSAVQNGQRVTFFETAPGDVDHQIGEVGSGKGTLRFTPMAGPGGMRPVRAVVTQGGIMRFNLDKVTAFRATKPGIPAAPSRVVATRKKTKRADTVVTSWTKVAGANEYHVTVVLNGRRRVYDTKKTKLKVPGLFDRSSAKISVAGVNALGQAGKAKRAKVAAPKPKHPPKKKRKPKK